MHNIMLIWKRRLYIIHSPLRNFIDLLIPPPVIFSGVAHNSNPERAPQYCTVPHTIHTFLAMHLPLVIATVLSLILHTTHSYPTPSYPAQPANQHPTPPSRTATPTPLSNPPRAYTAQIIRFCPHTLCPLIHTHKTGPGCAKKRSFDEYCDPENESRELEEGERPTEEDTEMRDASDEEEVSEEQVMMDALNLNAEQDKVR